MTPKKVNFGQRAKTSVNGLYVLTKDIVMFSASATNAVAASNTAVHAAVTLIADAKEVTTAITNPAIPRALRIKGNAAGIAGNVVIEGTNYKGESITETIALNEANAVDGTKAFKTVTKITLPAKTNVSGDTVSIGFCDKLGLPYLLSENTVLRAYLSNALEATAPTVTVSATAIESNTVLLNSALNGTAVNVYLMV